MTKAPYRDFYDREAYYRSPRLRIFVNANRKLTAIVAGCVYEIDMPLGSAFAVVETWLRGHRNIESSSDQQTIAAQAIEALIVGNVTIGNYCELIAKGDARIKMFNQNCNPSGQAGIGWAMCR